MWLGCDRPRHGAVADCMRRTRAAYHYTIRRVKRDEELIIRDRIANSILSHDGVIVGQKLSVYVATKPAAAKLLTVYRC